MKKLIIIALLFGFALQINAQNTQKKVTLYYDTSFGMMQKDLAAEFAFLEAYFRENPALSLYLIKFSNAVNLEETYAISGANWEDLKIELKNTIYDGASSFAKIIDTPSDEILLFTDGKEALDDLPQGFLKPLQIISSVKNPNTEGLEQLATSSRGVYHNLYIENAQDQATSIIMVSGKVSELGGPLANVSVLSRENNKRTASDESGQYSIEAIKGGILEYSFIGKNTLLAKVPLSGTKDIMMTDGNEVLDEVVITAEGQSETVNTGNTQQDKKTLGYAVESISEKDISQQDITVENAVSGQFSNVELKSDQDITQFLARGKNMSFLLDQTGLVVIDGVPMENASNTFQGLGKNVNGLSGMINPDNIQNITVLKGLAATNKYGTMGRNGVILITTKNGARSGKSKSKKDIVLGTTPTYTGDAESASTLKNEPYIKALRQSKTIDQAYEVYLNQRKTYGNDVSFFFNVADYFKDWNNPVMLGRILSNVAEFSEANNAWFLMAQGYKYQQFKMPEEAVEAYKRSIKLDPSNAQAYRNLGLAYREAKDFLMAQEVYNKINANGYTEVSNFNGLRATINNEHKNLVALHKNMLDLTAIDPFYETNALFDTRIVFEWNEFDAEFELQIVNPQNRFFAWAHTQKAEPARFANEKSQGYGLEEFFMTATDKGEWLFNITYFGKRTGDNSQPTFLKVTTYRNFGKFSQSQDIKVFSLDELSKKETLLKVKI